MAIRYKALTELYLETQRSVTAPDQWRAFLASACRNYRLSFCLLYTSDAADE